MNLQEILQIKFTHTKAKINQIKSKSMNSINNQSINQSNVTQQERPSGCDTVFVTGLPKDVRPEEEDELRRTLGNEFSAAGEVANISLHRNPDKTINGKAFVKYVNGRSCEKAVTYSGERIWGSTIRVYYSESKQRPLHTTAAFHTRPFPLPAAAAAAAATGTGTRWDRAPAPTIPTAAATTTAAAAPEIRPSTAVGTTISTALKPLERYQPSRLIETTEPSSILRKASLILNQLHMAKFQVLSDKFINVGIDTESLLDRIVEMIVLKAQLEEEFCSMYADLAKKIVDTWSSGYSDSEDSLGKTFRIKLLEKCRTEFAIDRTGLLMEIQGRSGLTQEEKDDKVALQKNILAGHMRFIGELYIKDQVTTSIALAVIHELLQSQQDEASLTCLVKLLRTIGYKLDVKARSKMDSHFVQIAQIAETHPCARLRFTFKDLVDARLAGWGESDSSRETETEKETEKETGTDSKEAAAPPPVPPASDPSSAAASPPLRPNECDTVFVKGLPTLKVQDQVQQEDKLRRTLFSRFSEAGEVANISFHRNPVDKSLTGKAFVKYVNGRSCEKAVTYSGERIWESTIEVYYSESKQLPPPYTTTSSSSTTSQTTTPSTSAFRARPSPLAAAAAAAAVAAVSTQPKAAVPVPVQQQIHVQVVHPPPPPHLPPSPHAVTGTAATDESTGNWTAVASKKKQQQQPIVTTTTSSTRGGGGRGIGGGGGRGRRK